MRTRFAIAGTGQGGLAAIKYAREWGMPNLSSLLRGEISRLARKELKTAVASLKNASAAQRSEIAALKKQVRELQTQLKMFGKSRSREAAPERQERQSSTLRFRASGLKSHRQSLGLSAKDYGLLVGASGLSIYKWEDGKVKPRAKALEALASVRNIGKKAALARLEQVRGGV